MQAPTIGLDLAKNVFQVHGVDAEGRVVIRRKLRRQDVLAFFQGLPPCLIGIEACATAHYWARELIKLGHAAKLMPPAYVKAYVKRQKNDAADAEAICEAVTRPNMRFVPVKSAEGQSIILLHRTRHLLVRQRTALISAMRSHLAEFGIIAAKGRAHFADLFEIVFDAAEERLPPLARQTLGLIIRQIQELKAQIKAIETELLAWHARNAVSQRLETIPGVGFVTATAIAASVADPGAFRSARQFAAWLGLAPRQNSSGGKDRLSGITKMGDKYIRNLLVLGATGTVRYARAKGTALATWITKLVERKPARLATVALANKIARIAWAVMTRGEDYRPSAVAAA
jgi:transposase